MTGVPYTCALCGGEFVATVSDEEARAELKANFNAEPAPDDEVVCDDCYKRVMAEVGPS